MSSKIKVDTIENVAGSGNVSLGSGHNLVVPGNISGTGDLAVNTNKIFVDASTDLIGIGTTSPATATGGGIDIHRNAGSSVRIEDTTNSVTGEFQVYSAGLNLATVTNHNLVLSTNNSAKMTITPEGYVLKPNTPAFNARSHSSSTSTGSFLLGSTNNSQTSVVIYNNGSHFNNTNGRFTAPVAGIYYFGCQATPSQGANSGIYIIKNGGSQLSGTAYQYSTSYNGSAVSAIVSLAVGDYVQGAMVPFNGTTEGQYDGNFCGALIG